MLLAGLLHTGKLAVVKIVVIDVSPIVGRCVHGETRSDGPVSSNDDIVLTSPTVPLCEAQLAVCILNDSGSVDQPLGNISIAAAAVTVPTQPLQIGPVGHSDEGLDFLRSEEHTSELQSHVNLV